MWEILYIHLSGLEFTVSSDHFNSLNYKGGQTLRFLSPSTFQQGFVAFTNWTDTDKVGSSRVNGGDASFLPDYFSKKGYFFLSEKNQPIYVLVQRLRVPSARENITAFYGIADIINCGNGLYVTNSDDFDVFNIIPPSAISFGSRICVASCIHRGNAKVTNTLLNGDSLQFYNDTGTTYTEIPEGETRNFPTEQPLISSGLLDDEAGYFPVLQITFGPEVTQRSLHVKVTSDRKYKYDSTWVKAPIGFTPAPTPTYVVPRTISATPSASPSIWPTKSIRPTSSNSNAPTPSASLVSPSSSVSVSPTPSLSISPTSSFSIAPTPSVNSLSIQTPQPDPTPSTSVSPSNSLSASKSKSPLPTELITPAPTWDGQWAEEPGIIERGPDIPEIKETHPPLQTEYEKPTVAPIAAAVTISTGSIIIIIIIIITVINFIRTARHISRKKKFTDGEKGEENGDIDETFENPFSVSESEDYSSDSSDFVLPANLSQTLSGERKNIIAHESVKEFHFEDEISVYF